MSRRFWSDLKPNRFMRLSEGQEVMPGLHLTPGMEAMLQAERIAADEGEGTYPPDPFAPGQLLAFVEWLQDVPQHSTNGLPRYMQALFDERTDLQSVMPDVPWGELKSYAWWAYLYGRYEVETFRYFGHNMKVRREVHPDGRVTGGADAIGFFNAEHGIGEAARLLVEALRAAEVPVSTIGYRNTESRQQHPFVTEEVGRYKTVIAAINAELNEPMRQTFGKFFFHDTYVIGQWFWELEVAPHWYKAAYKYVDELWAPTRFIEEMLRNEAPSNVHVEYMPLPLRMPRVIENARRSDLDLDDRFMFLFTFDFMSVAKRKNPMGLIEAFKKAFAPGEGPQLVLKCSNGKTRPEKFDALLNATEGRNDITIINRYLDNELLAGLMNMCDCYVSLHRSEGLGLTIAEAMLLGKPVIATGYSGNLDFMSEDTAYLVPWTRVKVGKDAEAYDEDATWAEPDLDTASALMREVFENPERARVKAQLGKADLESRFTPERTGARMKARLEHLWREQA